MLPRSKTPICPPRNCAPQCEQVFDVVNVSYLFSSGARISWIINPRFVDPGTWEFQIQVSNSGFDQRQETALWSNIGVATENNCQVVVESPVLRQAEFRSFRVKLTTENGIYYSPPVNRMGVLNRREWVIAREILRKERLSHRFSGVEGFILRPRLDGENCPRCLDPMTDEVTDLKCPVCFGTGKRCGYYPPIACAHVIFGPEVSETKLSEDSIGRTELKNAKKGRIILSPPIYSRDVWVNRMTDERYVLRGIEHQVKIKDVPLIGDAVFVLLPPTDPVYKVPIQGQIDGILQCG